jgi:hypothetical protein
MRVAPRAVTKIGGYQPTIFLPCTISLTALTGMNTIPTLIRRKVAVITNSTCFPCLASQTVQLKEGKSSVGGSILQYRRRVITSASLSKSRESHCLWVVARGLPPAGTVGNLLGLPIGISGVSPFYRLSIGRSPRSAFIRDDGDTIAVAQSLT